MSKKNVATEEQDAATTGTEDEKAADAAASGGDDTSKSSWASRAMDKSINAIQKPLDNYMGQLRLLKPLTDEAGFVFDETKFIVKVPPELSITLGSTENYPDDIEEKFAAFDKSCLNGAGKTALGFIKRAHKLRVAYKDKNYQLKSFTIVVGLSSGFEVAVCNRE